MMMTTRERNICRLVWLLLGVSSCAEPFPPYREPENVLEGELVLLAPDTIDLYYDDPANRYFINTPMILRVSVTNRHDDLLQGTARVSGQITVQSFAQIPRTLTVSLSVGDMRTPPVFQRNIALGPGSKAEFAVLWLPYATDGRIVFEGLPFTAAGTDKLYGPISFIASAEVQLFERI